jgi:hypothetical protein
MYNIAEKHFIINIAPEQSRGQSEIRSERYCIYRNSITNVLTVNVVISEIPT